MHCFFLLAAPAICRGSHHTATPFHPHRLRRGTHNTATRYPYSTPLHATVSAVHMLTPADLAPTAPPQVLCFLRPSPQPQCRHLPTRDLATHSTGHTLLPPQWHQLRCTTRHCSTEARSACSAFHSWCSATWHFGFCGFGEKEVQWARVGGRAVQGAQAGASVGLRLPRSQCRTMPAWRLLFWRHVVIRSCRHRG